jgi:phage tail sheath gpL-like
MTIPNDTRFPLHAIEFDGSQAQVGTSILRHKALLFGGMLAAGTKYDVAVAGVGPFIITSKDVAYQYFGKGSVVGLMVESFLANNKKTELHVVGLKDATAGVPAAGSLAFTGPATAAGVFALYINGVRLPVAVTSTMAASALATAVGAAINANAYLPVTATVDTVTVTVTAKNDGEHGNDINIRLNYNSGEELPTGIGCTITAMTSGATNPAFDDVLDLIGQTWYQEMVGPYNDATNLTAIEAELSARDSYDKMKDGIYFTGKRGTQGELTSFGNGRNSKFVCVVESYKEPKMACLKAAALAAQVAFEAAIDPARPVKDLPLYGIMPATAVDRLTDAELEILLWDGISVTRVDDGGVVRTLRIITMNQKNDAGADDPTWLQVEDRFNLMYQRYDFRTMISTKYPRAKLADDGDRLPTNQSIITPKIGKAEAVAWYRRMVEDKGLATNVELFKAEVKCIRDTADRTRLVWTLPSNLISQFFCSSTTILFKK